MQSTVRVFGEKRGKRGAGAGERLFYCLYSAMGNPKSRLINGENVEKAEDFNILCSNGNICFQNERIFCCESIYCQPLRNKKRARLPVAKSLLKETFKKIPLKASLMKWVYSHGGSDRISGTSP